MCVEVESLVPASPKHLPPVMGVDGERSKTPPPTPPTPQLLIMLNDTDNIIETSTTSCPSDETPHSSPVFFR